jgi:hypothetical protein
MGAVDNKEQDGDREKIPKAPSDVIYCAISLMQKWRLLLKEEDKKLFDQAKKLS